MSKFYRQVIATVKKELDGGTLEPTKNATHCRVRALLAMMMADEYVGVGDVD